MDDGAAMRVRRRGNSIRTLIEGFDWFDGAVENYLEPRLARALGKSAMQIRKIAQRSMRPHRKKRLGELTPYERDYYAPQKRDKRGRFAKGRAYDKRYGPNLPGEPGGPPRYSPKSLFDYRESVLAVFDPQTLSAVSGPVLGRKSRGRGVVKTVEHGGRAMISFGPRRGQWTYIRARPLMALAFDKARPYIQNNFRGLDAPTLTSFTE